MLSCATNAGEGKIIIIGSTDTPRPNLCCISASPLNLHKTIRRWLKTKRRRGFCEDLRRRRIEANGS